MATILQKSFQTGINLLSADTAIAQDGYPWLINGRNRYGFIEPRRKDELIENAPVGLKQGVISVGNVLVIFVSGKAYFNIDGTTGWIQIADFQLSEDAPQYWSIAVPFSTFHFVRKANADIHAGITASPDFKVSGTPECIVVQDGINQPRLIMYDTENQVFTSRVSKTYNEWANVSEDADDREYVPIGRIMMMFNQTLCIQSPDEKQMYRSITGRPLDFMVIVDQDGNKLPSENDGGAARISQAFDFDEITCLQVIDIADCFVWGTKKTTRIVQADYNNTLFGEPTFFEATHLNIGIVNQYSFSDASNDFICIEQSGVKSFNAVQQLKFKGNNSIFSSQLSKILYDHKKKRPIKQNNCSIVNFDNYLLCNLDTFYGNIIAVYDILLQNWVSLDITRTFKIKQFCIVDTEFELKLYCITSDNSLYRMLSPNEETEVAELKVRGFLPQGSDIEHQGLNLRCVFDGGSEDGECIIREYVDDQESFQNIARAPLRRSLTSKFGGIKYPVFPPVIPSTEKRIENPSFDITGSLKGKKISFVILWTNDSRLLEFQLTTSEDENLNSLKQSNETIKGTYK
jgi:hypothetical protein